MENLFQTFLHIFPSYLPHLHGTPMRFLLFFQFILQLTHSKTPCAPSWLHIAHLDSCFLSAPQPAEFSEALEYCTQSNASLVIINSEEEASIVREFFARENPSFFNWIGMRWNARAADFQWIDGKSKNYTYFLPGSQLKKQEFLGILRENFRFITGNTNF